MDNVLLDRRQSSGSFELPKLSAGRCRRATPRGAYNHRSFPTCPPYHQQHKAGGAWSSAPALPYAPRPAPMIYSSPSLPLLPSNHPPLLPLPPTANINKYATFPGLPVPVPPPPPPQARAGAVKGTTAATITVPAVAPPRQRDGRRRPVRPPPPTTTTEPIKVQNKKPLERATPLPAAPVVNAALDDLEQEVARNFVHDLLHVLAPPPSSLPLPSFSLVTKATPAPSCNVEAAASDAIRGLLRL